MAALVGDRKPLFMSESQRDRRVVITGMGVVSPLGNTPETLWNHLLEGACGIDAIQAFDVSDYDCRIAGEVLDLDPTPAFPTPKEIRRTDRYAQFGIYAAHQALLHSGLDLEKTDLEQVGAFIGSGIGGLSTLEKQHSILENKDPLACLPSRSPCRSCMASVFSMYYGLKGPNVATCFTVQPPLMPWERHGMLQIERRDVCRRWEAAVTPVGIGGFSAMKAMSTRNDEPKRASRPFDADRAGFVMGEGAAVLVLEELEHAKARGAEIFGELVGYGNTADAHHMTSPAPDGEGAARCMNMALRSAGMAPEAISYINAHSTPPQGDICETAAIKTVSKIMHASSSVPPKELQGTCWALQAPLK